MFMVGAAGSLRLLCVGGAERRAATPETVVGHDHEQLSANIIIHGAGHRSIKTMFQVC